MPGSVLGMHTVMSRGSCALLSLPLSYAHMGCLRRSRVHPAAVGQGPLIPVHRLAVLQRVSLPHALECRAPSTCVHVKDSMVLQSGRLPRLDEAMNLPAMPVFPCACDVAVSGPPRALESAPDLQPAQEGAQLRSEVISQQGGEGVGAGWGEGGREEGRRARTGLNSTSLAMPFCPMMEMAWSIPPDSVPTYFSQVAVKVASSCTGTSWSASAARGQPCREAVHMGM